MKQMEYLHKDITEKIIKAFYSVYNILGFGFLEKVYENAMMMELNSMKLICEKQKPIDFILRKKELENILLI